MTRLLRNVTIIFGLLLSPTLFAAELPAEKSPTASLVLTPARCVALHQGQVCYQRVQISWSSSAAGSFCLYQQDQTEPLHCWQDQSEATLDFEFAADTSQLFQLRNVDQQILAETALEVAWIYKASTRRKTHWRLF